MSTNVKRDLADDLISLKGHGDFWQVTRDEVIGKLVTRGPVLDAGCGAGYETQMLMNKGFHVFSLDYDMKLVEATKKINRNTWHADLTRFNRKDAIRHEMPPARTVLLADVIEHIEDDKAVLDNVNSLMVMGGRLIVSVPYHQFFWTLTDDARGHVRRYNRRELREKLEGAGFTVERVMFRSLLPMVPFMIARFLRVRIKHESLARGWRNSLLRWYFRNVENSLPLPFGTEIIVVARKVQE